MDQSSKDLAINAITSETKRTLTEVADMSISIDHQTPFVRIQMLRAGRPTPGGTVIINFTDAVKLAARLVEAATACGFVFPDEMEHPQVPPVEYGDN